MPLAGCICGCLCAGAAEADFDGFLGIGPPPEFQGLIPLQDHVIGKDRWNFYVGSRRMDTYREDREYSDPSLSRHFLPQIFLKGAESGRRDCIEISLEGNMSSVLSVSLCFKRFLQESLS